MSSLHSTPRDPAPRTSSVPVSEPSFVFSVLAHSSRSNALGRALAIADVASTIGDTRVFAIDDGSLWPASTQFANNVIRTSRKRMEKDVAQRGHLATHHVVWVSKGLAPLTTVVRALHNSTRPPLIVLDLDDDDVELSRGFRQTALLNRFKVFPGRRNHPARISHAQTRIARRADAFTYSSSHLRSHFAPDWEPAIVVPHVRSQKNTPARVSPDPEGAIRIGVLGTMRSHKGAAQARALLTSNRRFRIVAFKNSGFEVPAHLESQVVWLPTGCTLRQAYEQIDVALVYLDIDKPGAAAQLPAKYVDALSAGVPVLASPTEPMLELANPLVTFLPTRASNDQIAAAVLNLSADPRPQPDWSWYDRTLTPSAPSTQLVAVLLGASGSDPCTS